ncbi:hypothetical protein ACFRNJ_12035 [Streptomyces sp. NPDC056721]|uniref:hypothetical protein n=1 Tax=Streptomyces sp. NPDC056721 TaxID=3345923 RepID=UPI00368DC08E
MTAVQPEYEQPALPFEDEVLVVLYKREAESPSLHAYWDALEYTVRVRVKSLGFAIKRSRRHSWYDGDRLNIQLRVEAERT